MKKKRQQCFAIAIGAISNIKARGQDFPTMITVQYEVNGQIYEVTESIKLKSEKIKCGFFTVGLKRVPVIGNTAIGNPARVSYDPNNPTDAYLTDNIGKSNT